MKQSTEMDTAPLHGGDLLSASSDYQIPVSDWLDMSTGINPDGFPIPAVPSHCYQQLPQITPAFVKAVRQAYRCEHFSVAAGSQRFIELLPRLRAPCRVAVPDVGYQEHAYHWQRAGHTLVFYDGFQPQTLQPLITSGAVDVVLVINPCNPTAALVEPERLLQWHQQLAAEGKWLVVDEAFMDLTPQQSVASASHLPGLLVLRSLGKFYGLAGIRIGFLLAEKGMTTTITEALGCWPVTGPSQYIAEQALCAGNWQQLARQQLISNSRWLLRQLQQALGEHIQWQANSGFFVSVQLSASLAQQLYQHLARAAVLVRLWPLDDVLYAERYAEPQSLLRFGLISATNHAGREKFQTALSAFNGSAIA